MNSCQIALRLTPDVGVFELEVVVRPPLAEGASFEAMLPQHRVRCLYRYIVHTRARTIVRAKLARTSDTETDAINVVTLLEGLRQHYIGERAARAA